MQLPGAQEADCRAPELSAGDPTGWRRLITLPGLVLFVGTLPPQPPRDLGEPTSVRPARGGLGTRTPAPRRGKPHSPGRACSPGSCWGIREHESTLSVTCVCSAHLQGFS